ncbi:hypothetical protein F4821DRAFT_129212 [Hypoxylon rubiginosum]|uniref:Uncharacterized protein n=1 Tax=Hypoxylon rubiginosum TaxID=110542 RepID=A0ACC0D1A7_9PEZI|nr:hypothetical protein F4821DRAFT_129212 [Hypoxylon rubiginosum]
MMTRSTEADQGSARAGSGSRPPPNPSSNNSRVSHYVDDPAAPVNATLPFGISPSRDHTTLLDAVNLVFSGQHQASTTAAAVPTEFHSESSRSEETSVRSAVEDANTAKGAGGRVEGSHSS